MEKFGALCRTIEGRAVSYLRMQVLGTHTLQIHFNRVLGIALIVATLLPILILYLLSASGLVEATYVTYTHELPPNASRLLRALQQIPTTVPEKTQQPTEENTPVEIPLRLALEDPVTSEPRVDLFFDPVTGLWSRLSTNQIERIVVASQVFNFRADLPAWIVIASFPILGLLMGFILSMVMSRGITQPISELVEAVKAIGQRNLGYRVTTKGSLELQDLAQSFNCMAADLERAEITRRNLMADVAHELRTPLAVLDGNLRAMLDGVHALSEEEIALLYEQTRHLNRLVDDLRELSLAEANQLFLNRQEVDLAHLVKETISHFDLIAREQDIQLSTELEHPLLHPDLDENRVRQVLHNLLSNAFRYTPRGGNIVVSARRLTHENVVEIAVTDSGTGISPDDLVNIFTRFYRTAESNSHDREGSGLGLTIVKALVEAMGGRIYAQSAGREQGSTFTIHFPL
jgi:signal transduction histidine kinase